MFAVEMQQISKRFGITLANDAVNFHVRQGEIHALVGENGAGKSTLMHILYGIYTPDHGTISINGRDAIIHSPSDAISLGIGMVHQHFMLIPPLTVLENIILGKEGVSTFGMLKLNQAKEAIRRLSTTFHLDIDPDAKIETLSVGMQQRVEILKLLYRNAEILILDEPTPVLTPQEIDALFATLQYLKQQGKTIILITHKLSEVMTISDSVTIMRRGKRIASMEARSTSQSELARLMVGKEFAPLQPKAGIPKHQSVLILDRISAINDRNHTAVRNLSLTVAKGEIVGIAAVEGNGQSELVQVITGLRTPAEGIIVVDGINVKNQEVPISHIPEDRIKRGLVLDFSLKENLLLGRQAEHSFSGTFGFKEQEIRKYAADILHRFDVRPPDMNQSARNLSGGNQQKAVIGRELSKNASVIIASQPTRGLDIGAIEFVHRTLLDQREQGKAILLVSSDLDELLALSDRIAVMYEGEIVFLTEAQSTNQRELGQYMTGAHRISA